MTLKKKEKPVPQGFVLFAFCFFLSVYFILR